MEPAGLAVGVIGLAGLFSTCLEAVERFDSWKNFGAESRSLGSHLKAEKLRLERWGQAVGLVQGAISRNHHEALDDTQIISWVHEHLSVIKNFNIDDASLVGTSIGAARDGLLVRRHTQHYPSIPSEPRGRRVKWALRDKAKCTAQIEQLGQLVQDLHNLVPPDGPNGAPARYGRPGNVALEHGHDALAEKPRSTDFGRILMRIEKEIEAETRKSLHAWLLGRHAPSELFDSAVQRRLDGTCDWILRRPLFLDWASPDFPTGSAKFLWINGPAGFGKTVLCARVAEHLSSTINAPTAHFFFSSDFESRRDPFVAIRSWLSQLLSHPAAFDPIYARWEAQLNQVASRAEVVRVFREVLHAIPGCTFVIDGLDECYWDGEDWALDVDSSITGFLETIRRAAADTTTRIMVTSRDEPDIRHGMAPIASDTVFEYKITPQDVQGDTELYSRSIVDKRLSNKDETIKEDISRKLASRSHGQFLWLKMQESSLRGGKNKKQLEAAIDKTPTGLERLYDRNWEKILGLPSEERIRAFSLLRWAAFAVRPLTVFEITEALLIDDKCNNLRVDEIPDSIDEDYIDSEVLGLCGSLLELRGAASELNIGSRTVHLTHFSVKQYFIYRVSDKGSALMANDSLRRSNEAMQNDVLAAACLHYVNFPTAWEAPCGDGTQVLGSFRDYAAGSWYQHATVSRLSDPETVRLTNELFDTNNRNWHSWREWFDSNDGESKGEEQADEPMTAGPLYYASRLCLTETIRFIITELRCSVNDKSPSGDTPLAASCKTGNAEITKILLKVGADFTVADNVGRTPVYSASWNGHIEVVKLLLEKGADWTVATNDRRTPLIVASANGHIDVVKLLLEKGADWTVATNDGRTPLIGASANGHIDVVKLLLEKGADWAVATNNGWTPLIVASDSGYIEVVKLLLEKGADWAVATNNGWTPLNVASDSGHIEVVKLLLEKEADWAVATNDRWTPLNVASDFGHIEVVKLLLEKGADWTVATNDGWVPLNGASANGHIDMVKLLLEKGADWIVATNDGWTPLIVASINGHIDVVKLLLEKGADWAVATNDGWTLLIGASDSGHIGMVKLLLEKGASAQAEDSNRRTAVFFASARGHLDVVNLLLSHGVAVDGNDRYGSTPLFAATRNGHDKVVSRLLTIDGAVVDFNDGFGRSLLWWAAKSGNAQVLEAVLRFAQSKNTRVSDSDLAVESNSLDTSESAMWCDVCTRQIRHGSMYYHCPICNGGDFDICLECFEMSGRCQDDSHELILRQPTIT